MAGPVLTVDAIPAASVLLLRDDPLEVLMILRHEKSSFVPNAWVFPGGAVDAADGVPGSLDAARNAAVREVFEETAIRLEGELVPTSRWITPKMYPKRFDTWFFLTSVSHGIEISLHQAEAVDHVWIEPGEALERHRAGTFRIVFPTIKNLEAIADARSSAELIASRRGADIHPIEPLVINKQFVIP